MDVNFVDMVKLSLDKDLCDMLYSKRATVEQVMALQMLRLERGRVFQVAPTTVEGWSPNGIKWYPQEPGNNTIAEV